MEAALAGVGAGVFTTGATEPELDPEEALGVFVAVDEAGAAVGCSSMSNSEEPEELAAVMVSVAWEPEPSEDDETAKEDTTILLEASF